MSRRRPRLESLRKRAYRDDEGIHVFDADIRNYFGSIDQKLLMSLVAQRVSSRHCWPTERKAKAAGK